MSWIHASRSIILATCRARTGINVRHVTLNQRSEIAASTLQLRHLHVSSGLSLQFDGIDDMDMEELKEGIYDGKLTVIDVRNVNETDSTGVIPQAKILPLPRLSVIMRMKDEDFESEFGFPKPLPDQRLAIYCRSGVRAVTAIDALRSLGYQNLKRYPGGWLEWADYHPGLKREPDGHTT